MFALKHIITTILILTTLCLSSSAQDKKDKKGKWSGSLELSAGSNFEKDNISDKFSNTMGNLSFKLGYQRPKFFINLSGDAFADYNITNKTGFNFNFNEGHEKLTADTTIPENKSRKGSLKIDGGFILSKNDKLTFDLSQALLYSELENTTISIDFIQAEKALQYTDENGNRYLDTYNTKLNWQHLFIKPGRKLDVGLSFRYDEDERSTIWERGRGILDEDMEPVEQEIEKVYRITPYYIDNYINFGAKYTDPNFSSVENLNMDFSVDVQIKKDIDKYRAANLIKEEWIDSVRYRETFDYLSVKVDPTVNASYKTKNFNFKCRFTPEVYSDRLNDDNHISRLEKASVSPLGNLSMEWTENKHHLVKASCERGISRPDYLQMCWFQRPGAYSNELMEGNVDLLPCSSIGYGLLYKYSLKNFSISGEVRNTMRDKMIEKTYHNEEIDGRMYRVYTWINSGHSNTTSASIDAKFNGKKLKAELVGTMNWFFGVNNLNVERRSNDYTIRGNISYDFKKGFYAKVTGRYNSAIIRNYSKTTEYIGCDARIGKKFKKVEIYLDGRDLFENTIETETYSEDMYEGRLEALNLNRRCILLGVKVNL